jgi:anaerobic ribonucleoside-triphosphate reductase activating protein
MPRRGDDAPRLRLNRPVRTGVVTLGPGRRSAVWLQGCSLGCAGCVSRDTWDPLVGTEHDPVAVAHELLAADPDGVTISGGEPFEQPVALGHLLRELRRTAGPEVDVLCYSGFRIEGLRERHPDLLALLDVLVDGRYRRDEPTLLPWRGSANQRLHRLTPLAEARYADADRPGPRPALQVTAVGPDGLELAGIPEEGALARLEEAAAEAGVDLRGVSWR